MKKTLILVIAIIFSSCEKEEEINQEFNFDNTVEFAVLGPAGKDLLNPNNSEHIEGDDIRIFYVKNGVAQEVYNPNMDLPRNFKIYKNEEEYRIKIFLNHSSNNASAPTLIKWNQNDIDTIDAEFAQYSDAVFIKKIWLNNDPVWNRDDDMNAYPFIRINR